MSSLFRITVVLGLFLPAFALSSNLTRVDAPDDLKGLINLNRSVGELLDGSEASLRQGLRLKNMEKVAETVGAQKGYLYRMEAYMELLRSKESIWDSKFDFSQIMVNVPNESHNTIELYRVPAVIQESKNYIANNGGSLLKATARMYKILKPARLVTVPPNWRDYLLVNTSMGFNRPAVEVLPEAGNAKEQNLWAEHTVIGWERGLKQADREMTMRVEKLRTEFLGMVKYLRLREQGMLDGETVAVQNKMISGGGNELMLDSTVYQVTRDAVFNTNHKDWDGTVLDPRESLRINGKTRE